MKKKYTIKLSTRQRRNLKTITQTGEHKSRIVIRAQILLKSHAGLTDEQITEHCGVSRSTVQRTRRTYARHGLAAALYDAPRSGAPPKITAKVEARLIAIACCEPPTGYNHMTLELIQQEAIKQGVVKSLSTVAIWHHLTNRGIKPWREKNVVHSDADAGVRHPDGRYP
jgi:transposase